MSQGYKIISKDNITRVYDPDGIELKYIKKVEIIHEAGSRPIATITVLTDELDIEVKTI